MRLAKYLVLITGIALFMSGSFLQADQLLFELNDEFSGGADPQGPAPWVTATFDDNTAGGVTLTISTSGLVGSEFLRIFSFNYTGNPVALNVNHVSGDNWQSGIFGVDCCQADGDGKFDVELTFDNSPPANRFGAGETSVFFMPGTLLSQFNAVSAPGGGNGSFYVAAHIQSIGPAEESGWIGDGDGGGGGGGVIPEPSSVILLGTLIACAGLKLRRVSVR